ncbi:MAG: preprotein translocase subunit SecG [Patescibacteria group bacterium]|nr:preprotein translocase subunit SecG [Patescibacteria group bacterium]
MLTIAQIVVSIILIVLVLLQERSSGLSGVFGGAGGTPYQNRRGLEKFIYWATICSAVIFAGLAIVNLIIR